MFESSKGRLAVAHSLHRKARVCDLERCSDKLNRSISFMLENVEFRAQTVAEALQDTVCITKNELEPRRL
jgi:hypothetical protein